MVLTMTEQRQTLLSTIQSYGKQLLRFVRQRVKTQEDAEDILQDIWYQLSNMPEIETIEQMSGWLYQVARNRITDTYRKKKPESLSLLEETDEEGNRYFSEILLADNHTPETEHLRELFWDELMAGLEALPENQRQVFIWNELEDMTLQQIADKTGENLKTIISRKRYAVQSLKKRLHYIYQDFIQN